MTVAETEPPPLNNGKVPPGEEEEVRYPVCREMEEEEEEFEDECDSQYDGAEDEKEKDQQQKYVVSSSPSPSSSSGMEIALKCVLAGMLLFGAVTTYYADNVVSNRATTATTTSTEEADHADGHYPRRRLTAVMGDTIPSYMETLMKDLRERKKLFQDTPPEEVKYWFEYTGPLQVN